MPIPVWKKKAAAIWHIHAPIIIAIWLAAISAVIVVSAIEWMFSR